MKLMLSKIKKFFLSFIGLNKKTIPVLLFFIFLGVFLPFYPAQAFVAALAAAIIGFGIFKLVSVILLISYLFLGIAGGLLNFVTSPLFLDISYTTNDFVTLGWGLTRDLTNMFFILVLVVIALATILRTKEYQAKKTLPLLIAIILLINFTPVIAGIIIDFSNILMRFFLGEGIGINALTWGTRTLGEGITLSFQSLDPFALVEIIGTLILSPLVLIIFNFITGFIFILLALLFVMRPIALMLLVILSPIAFLSYVLPRTRDFWTQWWNQFIAWCLIGIVAGFFLYLTDQLAFMTFKQSWGGLFNEGVAAEEAAGGILVGFIPVLIVLGFLIMGFFMTISTSAMGAGHIISGAKKAGKWAGKWAGKTAWEKGKPWITEKIPESWRKWGARQAMAPTPTWGAGVKGIRGLGMRTIGAPFGAPLGFTRRAIGRAVGPAIVAGEKETAKAAEKKWTGALYSQKVSALHDETSDAGRAGIISAFNEDNEIEKLLRDERVKGFLTDERKKGITSKAGEIDEAKKVTPALLPSFKELPKEKQREAQNQWLKEVGVKVSQWEKDTFKIEDEVEKVIGRAKPANVKYFSSEALAGEGAQKAMHKFWHGAHVSEAAREFGKVFLEAFQNKGNKLGMEWYKANNSQLARYWSSSAAHGVGLEELPEKIMRKKEKKIAKEQTRLTGFPPPERPPRGRPGSRGRPTGEGKKPPRGRMGV